MDIMSDDLKSAKSALAKIHQDMEAINRLAKPSYLGVIEQRNARWNPSAVSSWKSVAPSKCLEQRPG